MGDRGNVAIFDSYPHEGELPVVLYTHWGGAELPTVVRTALNRRQRWDDGPYLARIMFDAMTEGDHGSETGFGISAGKLCDNEYPVLVIDTRTKRIAVRGETAFNVRVGPGEGLSLADFVALTDAEAQVWRDGPSEP